MNAPQHDSRNLVLDTNVLVHVLRGKALGQHILARYGLDRREWAPIVSAVTVGELHALARQWRWSPAHVARLDALVFNLHVVDVAPDIGGLVAAYGDLDFESRAMGYKMGKNDLWIAATAKIFGAVLLTCDKDFDHLAPTLIDRDLLREDAASAARGSDPDPSGEGP